VLSPFLFGVLPEEGAMFALQEPPIGKSELLERGRAHALPTRRQRAPPLKSKIFNDVY
jgi:hypothetical protein